MKRGFSDRILVRFPPNGQGSAWIKVELPRVFHRGLLDCVCSSRDAADVVFGDGKPGKSLY